MGENAKGQGLSVDGHQTRVVPDRVKFRTLATFSGGKGDSLPPCHTSTSVTTDRERKVVMHYYQFNIGDYKSHTEHLSEMEDLAYRRLLDWYYLHERPIPNDIEEIARQIRMRTHCECIANVLREFFVLADDHWTNKRAESELGKIADKSAKASASANARWGKKDNKIKRLPSDANALRTQSDRNAKAMLHKTQDTIHKTHINPPDGVSSQTWEDFKKLRKAKKAIITERVIDGLRSEASKIGWTLEQALSECLLRGWQSFKADWVKSEKKDVIFQTVPTPVGADRALREIEESRRLSIPMPENIREKLASLRGMK